MYSTIHRVGEAFLAIGCFTLGMFVALQGVAALLHLLVRGGL